MDDNSLAIDTRGLHFSYPDGTPALERVDLQVHEGARVAAAMTQMLIIRLGLRAETQAFALCARGYDGRLTITDFRCLTLQEAVTLGLAAAILLWMTTL
jgi:energy-coupling factor transporter transmembrane protein EcfT